MHNLWVFYYFFQKSLFAENYFGPRVYPRGSYVITHVRGPSVRGPRSVRPSVFKYLRDHSKDFSNFLHEVSAP